MAPNQVDFDHALTRALEGWNLPVSTGQIDLLRAHFEAVLETNRVMNLTRITDPVEAAVKHYADSLALLPWCREHRISVRTILDLGTGAGFPAVPLAVLQPDWTVTALDATGKKVRFLARVVDELQLSNLYPEHAHSHHWPANRPFEMVVVRALGPLAKCLEQGAGRVQPEGWIVVYKTATLEQQELDAAHTCLAPLGLHVDDLFPYELELKGQTLRRALHVFRRRI